MISLVLTSFKAEFCCPACFTGLSAAKILCVYIRIAMNGNQILFFCWVENIVSRILIFTCFPCYLDWEIGKLCSLWEVWLYSSPKELRLDNDEQNIGDTSPQQQEQLESNKEYQIFTKFYFLWYTKNLS